MPEKTLAQRAAAARRCADELEALRIKANDDARTAAAEAAALERAVDAAAYADHVTKYGEPGRAPVNLEASTRGEIQAALASGALTEQIS